MELSDKKTCGSEPARDGIDAVIQTNRSDAIASRLAPTQRDVKCLLMPAQISVTHLLVTQQFLAGAGQADFAVDHHIGPV